MVASLASTPLDPLWPASWLGWIHVFRITIRRSRQFARHEKQRFTESHKRERLGTSEHAVPSVVLSTAFVSTGREMIGERSVPLSLKFGVRSLDHHTTDADSLGRVA